MWWRFLIEIRDRYFQDRIYDQAAQLAYYFLLSLFPFLYVVFTVLGYLPFSSDMVLEMIQPYAPESTYRLLQENLYIILDRQNGGVLSISIIATIYLANMMFHSVIRILNHAYQVKESRPFWRDLLLGMVLMTGLLLAIVVSLALSLYGHAIGKQVFFLFSVTPYFLTIWNWIRWLISSTFLWLMFWTLYQFTPNTKISFWQAFPGSIFATLGWQLSSLLFSYYVSLGNYSVIYGNLSAIIILLTWFYLSAMILILGGVINATICNVFEKKEKKSDDSL
ncbi:YihY/virulence factor BrkB family protein [Risungbinella massiliensis]|uniref:YihY/virulence factor BrkB family protein n=1 Tax=Risungbinella massiliensis TaxID=1329796 RepID=UPI000699CFE8|nr:YihY/virulence factor BrkB family protein [Risungbinella massiliensis]